MANKIEIEKLDSLSANDAAAVLAINNNFTTIQEAINNTLSRDGTVPNFMEADIDLNTHRIINGGEPVGDLDYVTLKFFKENVGESAANAAAAELSAQRAASSAQSANISAQNAFNSAQMAANIVDAFDSHVDEKTQEFDDHAAAKTDEFNQNAAEKQAQVDASANAAAASAQESALSAGQALQSANNAEIWAEGTDAEVQTLGGTKSAKGWAEASENLNYTDITNCITKIPQDIKLELSNGTLTLKAGSKVYVPNGAGVFDEVTIQSDYTQSANSPHTSGLLILDLNGNVVTNIAIFPYTNLFSGTTQPSGDLYIWYDTTENKIKLYSNGSIQPNIITLPVASFIGDGSKITSIDQVFNGFGYIGSTMFVLPNVESLLPNGWTNNKRNNVKKTQETVKTVTITNSGTTFSNATLIYRPNDSSDNLFWAEWKYDDRLNYLTGNGTPVNQGLSMILGNISVTNGRITSFSFKNTFQAVDRNDGEWASTASKPSDRYVDLNLQASGTTYIAPTNGWVCLDKATGTADTFIAIEVVKKGTSEKIYGTRHIAQNPAFNISDIVPVLKGEEFKVYYNMTGATSIFRFIYDEGSK